jgi:hypothetical protein
MSAGWALILHGTPILGHPPQLDSPDPTRKDPRMARKTIRVSDQSGDEIAEGKGATVRITFADARKGVRELDLTDAEAERLGGRAVARRGRKPKS